MYQAIMQERGRRSSPSSSPDSAAVAGATKDPLQLCKPQSMLLQSQLFFHLYNVLLVQSVCQNRSTISSRLLHLKSEELFVKRKEFTLTAVHEICEDQLFQNEALEGHVEHDTLCINGLLG